MSDVETRAAGVPNLSGREISGTVIRYGDVAHVGHGVRECFRPGAFGEIANVLLTAHHARSMPLARAAVVDSNEVCTLSATLPETSTCDEVLTLIKNGVLRGLSMEFRCLREDHVDGVREIHKAELVRVSVVDDPAYPQSTVTAATRNVALRWLWAC